MGVEQENRKKLGFGLMRLPKRDGVIDYEQVNAMVDAFLADGYTYFDTAYVYEGSEEAFRRCIATRHPRDSYTVANKLPEWKLSETVSCDDLLNESLRRCGLDYFDFYLVHSLEEDHMEMCDRWDCFSFMKRAKADGRVRHIGFSFHGTPALLEKLLSEHPEVEFVQLQINYLDWDDPKIAAGECYRIARAHNVPIVVMEPVKGGTLANLTPEQRQVFDSFEEAGSPASLAVRYAGNLPGVFTVLSGMSNLEQVQDNLKTYDDLKPLTARESVLLGRLVSLFRGTRSIGCTACRYCTEGCPMGIRIPDIFAIYNRYLYDGDLAAAKASYEALIQEGSSRASDCIACGQCEGVCPQHLPIIELLREVAEKIES